MRTIVKIESFALGLLAGDLLWKRLGKRAEKLYQTATYQPVEGWKNQKLVQVFWTKLKMSLGVLLP